MLYHGYHGTCKKFNTLQMRGLKSAFVGRGIYFTNEVEDASTYADKSHCDHDHKIGEKASEIAEKRGLKYHQARKLVEKTYSHTPRIFSARFEINRPLILDKYKSHWVERHNLGRLIKLRDSGKVEEFFPGGWNTLFNALYDGCTTCDLLGKVRNLSWDYHREIFKAIGFDGVIMHNTRDWWHWVDINATHYTVFNRKQIKYIVQGELVT